MKLFIHGKWYDVSEFDHPGGPAALHLGDGRDATALFELHHPFVSRPRLARVLKRFEVPAKEAAKLQFDDPSDKEPSFDWESDLTKVDPFRTDLVASVKAYFDLQAKVQGIPFRQSYKLNATHSLLFVTLALIIAVAVKYFLKGYWTAIPVLSLSLFMLTVSLLHDGSHFNLSCDWRINYAASWMAPWLASSTTWSVEHVIGHHAYTNIKGRDPDVFYAPNSRRYRLPLPRITWSVIWLVATVSLAYINERQNSMFYNESVHFKDKKTLFYKVLLVTRISFLLTVLAWPLFYLPVWKALIFSALAWVGHSVCFMAFSQVSHLDEASLKNSDRNYWKHQTMTTIDYSNESTFWNWISIGLNAQTIHHLFPTIHSCHYPAVFPIIRDVCKRHNVNYQIKDNYWHAFQDYLALVPYGEMKQSSSK